MISALKTIGIAAIVFVVLDMLWLAVFMSKVYSEKLGYLGTMVNGKITFNLPVGLLTQLIITIGMSLLLLKMFASGGTLGQHLLYGALLGFVIYATYDLTNLSFVKGWPLDITLIDIAWGTFQGVVASAVIYVMGRV